MGYGHSKPFAAFLHSVDVTTWHKNMTIIILKTLYNFVMDMCDPFLLLWGMHFVVFRLHYNHFLNDFAHLDCFLFVLKTIVLKVMFAFTSSTSQVFSHFLINIFNRSFTFMTFSSIYNHCDGLGASKGGNYWFAIVIFYVMCKYMPALFSRPFANTTLFKNLLPFLLSLYLVVYIIYWS